MVTCLHSSLFLLVQLPYLVSNKNSWSIKPKLEHASIFENYRNSQKLTNTTTSYQTLGYEEIVIQILLMLRTLNERFFFIDIK